MIIKSLVLSALISTLPIVEIYPFHDLNWGADVKTTDAWAKKNLFQAKDLEYINGNFAGQRVTSMSAKYCKEYGLYSLEFHYKVSNQSYRSAYRDLEKYLESKYGFGIEVSKFKAVKGKTDYDLLMSGQATRSHYWKDIGTTIALEFEKNGIKLSFQNINFAYRCGK